MQCCNIVAACKASHEVAPVDIRRFVWEEDERIRVEEHRKLKTRENLPQSDFEAFEMHVDRRLMFQ